MHHLIKKNRPGTFIFGEINPCLCLIRIYSEYKLTELGLVEVICMSSIRFRFKRLMRINNIKIPGCPDQG